MIPTIKKKQGGFTLLYIYIYIVGVKWNNNIVE